MADDFCYLTKESLILMVPKKSLLLLRSILLSFSIICAIYICSICLEQHGNQTATGLLKFKVAENSCLSPDIELWKIQNVHYPSPKTYSREECICNPVRFFAIVSTQRSGSGWFETLLNSHINVSSNGEIFSIKVRRSNISTIVETMDKIYNMDWYTSASRNECTAAIGFKWMLNQGLMQNHEEIVDYFNRRGVLVIFLFRRNLLRRMISVLANSYDRDVKRLNGTHKSHVHSLHEAEILANYKPFINVASLVPSLKQVEEAAAKALEYFKRTNHIIMYYEDIVKNGTKLEDVQGFLGVPQRDLKSRQVKIHKGRLSEYVKNWDDVQKALKETPYERFLYAD